MIDERKIEIVAKNFSSDFWDKYEKTLEKMIRSAYIEGFKEGVRKGIETCNRCEGKDENFEHGTDVCKSCRRGVMSMNKGECKKQIESLKSIEQYCKKHMQENGICDCIFADSNICILADTPCLWDIEQVVITQNQN